MIYWLPRGPSLYTLCPLYNTWWCKFYAGFLTNRVIGIVGSQHKFCTLQMTVQKTLDIIKWASAQLFLLETPPKFVPTKGPFFLKEASIPFLLYSLWQQNSNKTGGGGVEGGKAALCVRKKGENNEKSIVFLGYFVQQKLPIPFKTQKLEFSIKISITFKDI